MNKQARALIRKLNTPVKIQEYLYTVKYNPDNSARSARRVLETGKGHCFEGAMVAAFLLEQIGQRPLVMDLRAHNDDDHVVTLFKEKGKWGAISKTNTAVLGYRVPIHRSLREIALSYFPVYLNIKGRMTLVDFAGPINLASARFKKWDWRYGDENCEDMGISFNKIRHQQLISRKDIVKLPKAHHIVAKAALLGALRSGLYQA
jgi:hypothetical protein